jgi:hypothetical protein
MVLRGLFWIASCFVFALVGLPSGAARAEVPIAEVAQLRSELAAVRQLVEQLQSQLAHQQQQIAQLAPATPAPAPAVAAAAPVVRGAPAANYLNLSLDVLTAAGASTARDVVRLQGGDHDPSQRGFTLQNAELVLEGAVDPYMRGQANIALKLDPEGETTIEIEEAFLTTTALPNNMQLKLGQYFSDFGRQNVQHPHSWDFVDQPIVNTRFLGGDGLRGPGARVSWLTPTDFYSEVMLSVQNSQGETASSFRSVPGEEVQLGRPVLERDVRTPTDLLIIPRYTASFDLSETQTLVVGATGAFGPNGTGSDESTRLYGMDMFWKWKPTDAEAGFPFVKVQGELMSRFFEAGAATLDTDGDGVGDLDVPSENVRDWGMYSQVVWGFRRGFALGLRGEYLEGEQSDFDTDPFAGRRWRVSPNLTWYPTEYSRFRLQWNHDDFAGSGSEESVFAQFEFLLGAHAAHKF